MALGEARPLTLTSWVWLHTGIDRRILGWSADDSAWITSAPIAAVASSRPGTPPLWATTATHRALHLSEPAPALSDDMLHAIDRFRDGHPFFERQAGAPMSVRLWRAQPHQAVTLPRRTA